MREKGLIPLDERKAGENVVRRNTVNNPAGFEAGLQTTKAAARANAGSGGTAGRRRTLTHNEGDDAEELALMTLYPDDVSGIIMRAQDFDLTFDEPDGRQNEGKAALENWSGLNQSQEMAVGAPDVSEQGASHQGKDSVVPIATGRWKHPKPDQLLATHRKVLFLRTREPENCLPCTRQEVPNLWRSGPPGSDMHR
jgi:hypothetical protein